MYEKSGGLEWLSGVVRRGKERRRVEETVGGVGVGGVVGGVRATVKNTKPGMSLDSSSHCAKLYYVTGPFWLKVLFIFALLCIVEARRTLQRVHCDSCWCCVLRPHDRILGLSIGLSILWN